MTARDTLVALGASLLAAGLLARLGRRIGLPTILARGVPFPAGYVLILALATAVRFYCVSWLGERVVADLRLRVQANLLRLSPSFFEANSPKEISSRMTSDTTLIEQVAGTTVSVALRNGITAIAGLVVLIYMAPWLTLGLVFGIPVVIGPIVWFGRRLRG